MQQKIVKLAEERPAETVNMVLRYYDHEDNRVRMAVKGCLTEIFATPAGKDAILSDMVHSSRNIRKAVQSFLGEEIGAHAITYASFYEQTMLLVAMSKRKNIPVDDIVALAEISKQTFIEGEIMEAVKDIGFCLDYIKHRYKNSEQLKEYVTHLLQLAPDLSKMGVYSSSIEEPLRKAMKASRNRSFDETREIIENRVKEARMRNDLMRIGRMVKESVITRPKLDQMSLRKEDEEALRTLHGVIDSVTSLILSNNKEEAIGILSDYIEEQTRSMEGPTFRSRLSRRDQSAILVVYSVGIVSLKLASSIIPVSSEDIYQQNFRHLDDEPSIHLVLWPDAVMRMFASEFQNDKDQSLIAN